MVVLPQSTRIMCPLEMEALVPTAEMADLRRQAPMDLMVREGQAEAVGEVRVGRMVQPPTPATDLRTAQVVQLLAGLPPHVQPLAGARAEAMEPKARKALAPGSSADMHRPQLSAQPTSV